MNRPVILAMLFFALPLIAQAQNAGSEPEAVPSELVTEKATTVSKKKPVDSATINLQTTVTGSQEQPRVLYIMPWQSPATPELDMQMLSSQQDAVFGHVEREELLRNLEAAGELDNPQE